MKAFKSTKLKSIGRKLSVLGITALLAVSCGSDKNETSPSTAAVPGVPSGTSPVFGSNGNDLNYWNQLKSQINCDMNQGRMQDLTFSAQSNGYLQQGATSGTNQGSYYGQTENGDLVYVSKVMNGNQLAYNVVLSYCIYRDQTAEYIGPNAGMSNFVVQQISLNNNGTCGTGAVTNAWISFYSQRIGQVSLQYASAGQNCY